MKWDKIILSQAFSRQHGHCCTEKGPCGTGTDYACISTCTMTQLATVRRSERNAMIFAYPGRYTINSYELSILSHISIVSPSSSSIHTSMICSHHAIWSEAKLTVVQVLEHSFHQHQDKYNATNTLSPLNNTVCILFFHVYAFWCDVQFIFCQLNYQLITGILPNSGYCWLWSIYIWFTKGLVIETKHCLFLGAGDGNIAAIAWSKDGLSPLIYIYWESINVLEHDCCCFRWKWELEISTDLRHKHTYYASRSLL